MTKAKRVCPTCKTTKFRKSTDSGLVCKYGHKLLGIQEETAEDDGFGSGIGKRRKQVQKQKEQEKLGPAQQKSDFLLIIQYALQVYTKCMVQELNFPPELETTCRELWLLYLSDSKVEIAEAYLFEAHEKEINDKLKNEQQIKKDIYEKIEQEELTLDDVLEESESESEEDDDKETLVHITSNSSRKAPKDSKSQKYKSIRNRWPPLAYSQTMTFIYLTCIYLNYPILPNDLIRWCKSNQIPYLSIQEKIPERQLGLLSFHLTNTMTHIPTVESVVVDAYKLSRCFLVNCKLEFPNYNIPLYLDRFCAQFFLPVEGYFYANMLFESRKRVRHCVTSRGYQSTSVTTVLMACVVETTKLIYGLGDVYDVTADHVSEFDTKVTRETWLNRIQENIKRWKLLEEEEENIENIISLIRGVTVAAKAGAHAKDKQGAILNVMNQSIMNDNAYRMNRPTLQTNMLMDTYDMIRNNTIEPANQDAPIIKQGDFFYKRRNGFSPNDYLKMLELARLITGETSNHYLETAIKDLDTHIYITNPCLVTKQAQYKKRYKILDPLKE